MLLSFSTSKDGMKFTNEPLSQNMVISLFIAYNVVMRMPPAGEASSTRMKQSGVSSFGLSGMTNNGGTMLYWGTNNKLNGNGNLVNGGNIGRRLSSGGLSMPGVASPLNLTGNNTPQPLPYLLANCVE
ncbi:hypothetical protein L1887_27107 [Cichorium endivia]|nr:hypothetical protein L1887_27107 [Cichorium endivia]